MIEKIRSAKYAFYKNNYFRFIDKDDNGYYTLIDDYNHFNSLKELGFKKYDDQISVLESKHLEIKNAFRVTTYAKYKGFKFELQGCSNNKCTLFPMKEAMEHFNDFPRMGHDPVYHAEESELEEIWEERTPIEGFKFDVEPIHYIKKDGKYLE